MGGGRGLEKVDSLQRRHVESVSVFAEADIAHLETAFQAGLIHADIGHFYAEGMFNEPSGFFLSSGLTSEVSNNSLKHLRWRYREVSEIAGSARSEEQVEMRHWPNIA